VVHLVVDASFAFSTTAVLGLLHEHVAPVRRRTVVVALAFDESVLAYTGETIVFVYVVDGHRVPFVLAVRSFALQRIRVVGFCQFANSHDHHETSQSDEPQPLLHT
jgi:hypothetical protein